MKEPIRPQLDWKVRELLYTCSANASLATVISDQKQSKTNQTATIVSEQPSYILIGLPSQFTGSKDSPVKICVGCLCKLLAMDSPFKMFVGCLCKLPAMGSSGITYVGCLCKLPIISSPVKIHVSKLSSYTV